MNLHAGALYPVDGGYLTVWPVWRGRPRPRVRRVFYLKATECWRPSAECRPLPSRI